MTQNFGKNTSWPIDLAKEIDKTALFSEIGLSLYNLYNNGDLSSKIENLKEKGKLKIELLNTGFLSVDIESQLENDRYLAGDKDNAYKAQFIDGNFTGFITPTDKGTNILPKEIADKLNTIYGKPGNGTFFDIQRIFTFAKSENGQILYEMYTQVKDTDEGLIFTFAYETQELLQDISTDTSQYYLNTILSVSINMNKFNIDTTSYMFTHNMRECISTAIETERNKLYNLKNSNLKNNKVTDFLGALINITIASGNYKIINGIVTLRQRHIDTEPFIKELDSLYQSGLNELVEFSLYTTGAGSSITKSIVGVTGLETDFMIILIVLGIILLVPIGV